MARIVQNVIIVLLVLAAIGPADSCAQSAPPTKVQGLHRTADMGAARASHTATLLNDGRVLIAGGFVSEDHTLSGTELFDPLQSKFTVAANMSAQRSSHTATLLPNGKVLIAGGFNGDYLKTAELFDPKTDKFTQVGNLTEGRSNHVAVLLKDGKVLLAGGVGTGWTFLKSAEIFDPATNSFAKTGDLAIARESHSAALLPDGKVFIAGGHSGRRSEMRVFSETEIYDPATGKFAYAGEMTVKRHKHAALGLDGGRVLIVDGADERDARGAYRTAEIYDSLTRKFIAVDDMSATRYKLQGTVVRLRNGKVLVAGGSSSAEVFDPQTNEFSTVKGSMGDIKLFATATLLQDGSVLITGGYNHRVDVSSAAWVATL